MKQLILAFIGAVVLFIAACKKNDAPPTPQVALSVSGDTVYLSSADSLVINSAVINGTSATTKWYVNDSLVSNIASVVLKNLLAGTYKVQVTATNESGVFKRTIIVIVDAPLRPVTATSSKYISQIIDFLPAPGQFVNEVNISSPTAAQKLIGSTSNLVSLGGYGGYIVFGFDHSIANRTGYDLAIYGNPLAPPSEWSEPGIVMVSQDVNGNGKADDPWYELAGSEYNDPTTIKNYSVTYYNPGDYKNVPWKDNKGNTGAVEINAFHKHNFYPLFAPNQDSITFTGTVMRNTFGQMTGSSIYINGGFPWGYIDNWSSGDNYAQNRYNSFDISWAVDAKGNKVALKSIDFVKVYTGQNSKGNTLLGEISTEVKGAVDLNMP